ncbi:hypothetical protein DPMN_008297 [Dreissena polymorpha]|uniref:Uncharacterized protein n=1 Tax=Dreissena polymorpha TaxID=45954 RepID=A0A9D4MXT4_DREPO|nr:hypothetical protein DPMN_008297 [Dreissena polymorpha]
MKLNSVYGVRDILAIGVKFSELITLKQAEAESAKIKQKYTQQEAALLKQKAESEANFQVISQQKAFEAAAAEIKHEALMDIKFKLQTLPVVKPDNLVQDYIKKSTKNPTVSDTNIGENLCKFLLKKDLALSRLTIFSDKAESYQAWKTSFKNVMFEMNTSASEEMGNMLVVPDPTMTN